MARVVFTSQQRELLRQRLLRHSSRDEASGCRLWHGHKHHTGYGRITVRLPDRKHPVPVAVHRLAYWVFKRRPPQGREIAHSIRCCSPLCIEPTHLRATTRSHNERDKKRAKRWRQRNLREIFPPTIDFGVRQRAQPLPA